MSGRQILIGSSTEGLPLASLIADAVTRAGLDAQLWTEVFPPGQTLLEELEQLAATFHGAILVMTPDTEVGRHGTITSAPAGNVLFEYAYLSARLTRRRVAICRFMDVALPSYLEGVKVISGGAAEYTSTDLPAATSDSITRWLHGLPRLAGDMPAASTLHAYSGRWEINTSFERWQGADIVAPDRVYFAGITQLAIPVSGSHGRGTMYGSTRVELEAGYKAQWNVINDVPEASVDDKGQLSLVVNIISRHRVEESGSPPSEHWRDDLPPRRFEVLLEPAPAKKRTLRGVHQYEKGQEPFQTATEVYRYSG